MLQYEGDVYRPPSEWRSLIVQATVGCSNNSCTFCGMYKEDVFHVKDEAQLFRDLEEEAYHYSDYERIFVADGDALCLPTDRLLRLFHKLKDLFKRAKRIGIYATARDVNRKSLEDLVQLREAGLGMVYLGVETGSRDLLKEIKKNMSPEDMVQAAKKLHEAGLAQSVTLIAGLAGRGRSIQYAAETAQLVSQMNPDYVSYLTLNLQEGSELMARYRRGDFVPVGAEEALAEIYDFLNHYQGQGPTVFRSNHASNYLALAGDLPQDIPYLKKAIENTIETGNYRAEFSRRL
ncbi:MAG: radical SAM protein [Tissierellia bacterium]|nr:radical SAM protein [Tissierellia bacterium]